MPLERNKPTQSYIITLTTEREVKIKQLINKNKTFFQFLNLIFLFCLPFRAARNSYGSSQTRGPIGAVAAGLYQSHSNTRSEPRLQPAPQITATLEP